MAPANNDGHELVLTWIRSRSRPGRTAASLYGSIVTQARSSGFYIAGDVADTMEGRFGVIVVHVALVMERIRKAGEDGDEIGRALLETFMTDMDDNLREIGISDLGVPRRIKKAAAALHEQMSAYREALSTPGNALLTSALERFVLQPQASARSRSWTAYVRRAAAGLDQQSWQNISEGRVDFPAFEAHE